MVFKKISDLSFKGKFGADDLKAAHLLHRAGKNLGFAGRGSGIKRAMTRYLFYYAFIELIRELGCEQGLPSDVDSDEVTRWVLALARNEQHFDQVTKAAARSIDEYTAGTGDPEPPYRYDEAFKAEGNWEVIVKSHRADAEHIPIEMPRFRRCIRDELRAMKIDRGQGAPFEIYRMMIRGENY